MSPLTAGKAWHTHTCSLFLSLSFITTSPQASKPHASSESIFPSSAYEMSTVSSLDQSYWCSVLREGLALVGVSEGLIDFAPPCQPSSIHQVATDTRCGLAVLYPLGWTVMNRISNAKQGITVPCEYMQLLVSWSGWPIWNTKLNW